MNFRALTTLGIWLLAGCGTYYDPSDSYVRGLRFHDRGDYVAAKQIWEQMARAGDCDAQFRMGLLHVEGRAVEKDLASAVSWWTKAADQGQPRAQLALGDFYNPDNSYTRLWCKVDCSKDAAVAYKWYLLGQRSAGYENDKKYAALVLAKIASQLTSEQRSAGEEAATEWHPAPKACKPRVLL